MINLMYVGGAFNITYHFYKLDCDCVFSKVVDVKQLIYFAVILEN